MRTPASAPLDETAALRAVPGAASPRRRWPWNLALGLYALFLLPSATADLPTPCTHTRH